MKGKLCGIGVGPGNPDLMTLKAKQLLDDANVIAYPVKRFGEDGTALEIIKQRVDIAGKDVVELLFKMDPDDEIRKRCRTDNVERICRMLDEGKNVAMIALGDVAIYSTYMHLDREIRGRGYMTEVVPGVPAMCSGAALARLPLMIGEESLSVVSMAKHDRGRLERILDVSDNIVVMKAFASIPDIADMLNARGIPLVNATVMSNMGMEDEYIGPLDPARPYGYFTTVLIKKKV